MRQPLLSICIPTFNRVTYLRELLPRFISELSALDEQSLPLIELLISNNASTDSTETYIKSLTIPRLRYYRNEQNIGGDPNFLACIERATGEYVWLFGDDDILLEHGIVRLLSSLSSHHPDLLILDDAEPTLRSYPTYKHCLIQEMQKQSLFPLLHTLITANVFKRRLFDLLFARRMLCMNYAHIFGLMRNIAHDGNVAVMGAVMTTRPQRAQFEKWPFALCVKQGIYLCCLAHWTGYRLLYRHGMRACMNLPMELASRIIHRFFPHRYGRT